MPFRSPVLSVGWGGNRVAAVGASNVAAVGAGDTIELDGFVGWSWLLASDRVRPHRPEAVGGFHLADVRDLLVPRLLGRPPLPHWCIVHAGSNDLAGRDPAAMLATAAEICDRLTAAGVAPIVTSLPPQATTANLPTLLAFNHGLARLAGERGMPFADLFAAVEDPSTGTFAAGCNVDGVHFSALGAARAGRAVADVLRAVTPPWMPPLPTTGDPATESTLLAPNPLMLRRGERDGLPAGWRFLQQADAASCALVPAAVGNWLEVRRRGGPGSTVLATTPASVTPGCLLAIGYRAEVAAPNEAIDHGVQCRTDDGRILCRVGYGQGHVGDVPPHVVYREVVAPPGSRTVHLRVLVSGGGAFRIGQVLLRDLTLAGCDS